MYKIIIVPTQHVCIDVQPGNHSTSYRQHVQASVEVEGHHQEEADSRGRKN